MIVNIFWNPNSDTIGPTFIWKVFTRVADPGGVNPDPTFKKKPDPTLEKNNPDTVELQFKKNTRSTFLIDKEAGINPGFYSSLKAFLPNYPASIYGHIEIFRCQPVIILQTYFSKLMYSRFVLSAHFLLVHAI